MVASCAYTAHSSTLKSAYYAHDISVRAVHNKFMDVDWFKQRKKDLGLKDEDLAPAFGVDRSVVNKVINGKVPLNARRAAAIASALDVTPDEILFRAGILEETAGAALAEKPALDRDEVELQEWDIAYGMGGGTYLDLPVTGEPHTFSRAWLRNFTHAPPEKVFLARGSGDSMTPTILDSDMVIIDTADHEVRIGDKIWAVVYGTTGYIKRIRPMPDGSVKLLSDNPNVPPETAYDGELSVVGRVVAIIRKT